MVQREYNQRDIEILADAVSKALGMSGEKRFIDLERIPLICLSISNISKSMDEIRDMIRENKKISDAEHEKFVLKSEFFPYRAAINTVAVSLLLAIVGAFISLIFVKI